MSTSKFVMSDLTSGYGGSEVLRGIDAEISAGSFTALIGPNGSGKSTLLRALAGLQPYGGVLTLDGREVRTIQRREFGRIIGVVPQNFRVNYPFSVWEVVCMGRLPRQGLFGRMSEEDEARVADAARRVGIEGLMSRDATSLSGGEAQRVAMACALAQDTPVLLLDEPTSALDPNQASRVFALLRELADEGRTIIAVVHDVNAVLPFCDRYMALSGGVLISRGTAADLNGDVLMSLYGTPFMPYYSERGDAMWRALAK